MRRSLVSAVAAASLLVVLPGRSEASTADWLGLPVCTVGSIEVCISVQDLTWDATNNHLSFTILNLSPDMGMEHWVTRIGFYHNSTGTQWVGTAQVVSLPSGWSLSTNAIGMNGSGFELELGVGTDGVKNGIGPDGSATFVIWLSEEFLFDASAELRWHTQAIEGGQDLSIKCDTGWDDPEPGSSYPPCQVVPEPFTIALLGTGLAGVGGAALRRRRRKDGDIVTD